jgi:hypothetical protein
LGLGAWGLGFGVWGFGPNPQSPIPNPQSPIPNPHDKYENKIIQIIKLIKIQLINNLKQIKNNLFRNK